MFPRGRIIAQKFKRIRQSMYLKIDRATAIPDGTAMQTPVISPHGFPRVSISWVGQVSTVMKNTPIMPTRNPTPTQISKEKAWNKPTRG